MLGAGVLMLAVTPSSTNYKINNYGFGAGGVGNSSSASYSLNALTGETSGQPTTSTTYNVKPGEIQVQQAYVPLAPTFDNPSNYYSRLHFVINTAGNPSDTKFAIAISEDGFATDTRYVKSDGTVGATLAFTDYQDYATWGGATGSYVVGLKSNTTYTIKVKAYSGRFTETQYGPTASASTSPASLTFDIDVSASDTETSPPYVVDFGNLYPATPTDANEKIWFDIDTNAESGAKIYMSGNGTGLVSAAASYTIPSATADLASATIGFGAQSSSATQTSGGPLAATTPYDGTGQSVGIIDQTLRQFYSAPGQITAGRTSLVLKAKADATTPAGNDYTDILTAVAAASF